MGGALVHTAYLALGSNLGDRFAALQQAVDALSGREGVVLRRASPVYETPAHTLRPDHAQPPYLNAVLEVATTLPPARLLAACLDVEAALGRARADAARWAPRTLDVDVLLYGRMALDLPELIVPHPRLGARRFVLQPLVDLAPGLHVPAPFDASAQALLDRCPDRSEIARLDRRLVVPAAEESNA